MLPAVSCAPLLQQAVMSAIATPHRAADMLCFCGKTYSKKFTYMTTKPATRQRLITMRQDFAQQLPQWHAANTALRAHLMQVLAQMQPECLGVYWPIACEFNAAQPWPVQENALAPHSVVRTALPYAQKTPPAMHYRAWDGDLPTVQDAHHIPTASGPAVVPDVILVPCLGYTSAGYRLGYGGGYFDRYLAAHPHITTIGVAWSCGYLDASLFSPEAHDQRLMVVVTEQGVVG
jgi:5-formyltetrahydrofolate cyclo-ligase